MFTFHTQERHPETQAYQKAALAFRKFYLHLKEGGDMYGVEFSKENVDKEVGVIAPFLELGTLLFF